MNLVLKNTYERIINCYIINYFLNKFNYSYVTIIISLYKEIIRKNQE